MLNEQIFRDLIDPDLKKRNQASWDLFAHLTDLPESEGPWPENVLDYLERMPPDPIRYLEILLDLWDRNEQAFGVWELVSRLGRFVPHLEQQLIKRLAFNELLILDSVEKAFLSAPTLSRSGYQSFLAHCDQRGALGFGFLRAKGLAKHCNPERMDMILSGLGPNMAEYPSISRFSALAFLKPPFTRRAYQYLSNQIDCPWSEPQWRWLLKAFANTCKFEGFNPVHLIRVKRDLAQQPPNIQVAGVIFLLTHSDYEHEEVLLRLVEAGDQAVLASICETLFLWPNPNPNLAKKILGACFSELYEDWDLRKVAMRCLIRMGEKAAHYLDAFLQSWITFIEKDSQEYTDQDLNLKLAGTLGPAATVLIPTLLALKNKWDNESDYSEEERRDFETKAQNPNFDDPFELDVRIRKLLIQLQGY
ncbi:MAG: hypothetical protein KDC71_01835 [Acidobacteria bacterium]|nr:hypothetical protein [Acidobacteriota bacterium]